VTSLASVGQYLVATTSVADFEARFGATHRLQVFDVSDPANPIRVWVGEDLGGASDVTVAGTVAFVASEDRGIFVYDLFEPTQPFLEGRIPTLGNASGLGFTRDALY